MTEPPPPPSPTCIPNDELQTIKIGRVQRSADGKLHVKYGFFDALNNSYTPPQQVAKAFDDAFSDWNSKSETTKVVFERVGPNDRPNIIIELTNDPERDGGCAQINSKTGFINYSSTFAALTGTKPEMATAGVKHEIIHYLGVEEIGYAAGAVSIASENGGTCSDPLLRTTSIQTADASKAAECTQSAQDLQSSIPSGGGGDTTYTDTRYADPCWEYWAGYDVYMSYWTGDGWGWQYVGTVWVLQGNSCTMTG